MPSMPGPLEILIIVAIALIVFGPARLPEIARSVGKAMSEFRRQAADLKAEFDYSLDEEDDETPPPPDDEELAKPALDPDPQFEGDELDDPDEDPSEDATGAMDPDPAVPVDPEADQSSAKS